MFNKLKEKLSTKSYQQILVITVLLVLSRFFGFFRQALIGSAYIEDTAVKYSDVFLNAQKVQDVLIAILIMGTFITTLTPTGAKLLHDKNEQKFSEYIQLYLILTIIIFFVISTVCFLFIDDILRIFQNSFYNEYKTAGVLELYLNSAKVLCFGVGIFAVNTILQIYLNLKNSFIWNNLSGIVTNFVLIVVLLFNPGNFVFQLSVAIIVSFGINTLLHLIGSYKVGLRLTINSFAKLKSAFVEFKQILIDDLINLIPRMAIVPLAIVASVLISYVGGDLRPTFYETSTIIQGIFLTLVGAVGMVILPKLSQFNTTDSKSLFIERINSYALKFIPIALIGSLLTFVGARFLLLIILSANNFKKGNFNFVVQDSSFNLQVNMIHILAVSIVFLGINEILIKYYLIKNKIKKLLIFNTICMVILISGVLYTVKYFNYDLGLVVCFYFTLCTAIQTLLFYLGITFDKNQRTN
jgi:peptidoglycan biosynthesis protein MviN/MurJ (putative lipid II flippase)